MDFGYLTGELSDGASSQMTSFKTIALPSSFVENLNGWHEENVTMSIFCFSRDCTVREWDLLTMTSVRVLQGHKGPIRDVKVRICLVVPCFLSLSILP